jgi:hypothetical protein
VTKYGVVYEDHDYSHQDSQSLASDSKISKSISQMAELSRLDDKQTAWYSRIIISFLQYRFAIHRFFEDPQSSRWALVWAGISFAVIVLSVSMILVESLLQFYDRYTFFFFAVEAVVATFFTIEYVIRISSSTNPGKFLIQPLNIIDLLSVLPFYVDVFLELGGWTSVGTDQLTVLRIIRLTRVFRVFKVSRFTQGFSMMVNSLKKSNDALILVFFLLSITVILFSSLIYYFERGVWNPQDRHWYREDGTLSPFQTIPDSFWWCIVTVSTVGYGDAVPITIPGKMIAAVAILVGVIGIAFPITIIGTNFSEEWLKWRAQRNREELLKRKGNLKKDEGMEASEVVLESEFYDGQPGEDSSEEREEEEMWRRASSSASSPALTQTQQRANSVANATSSVQLLASSASLDSKVPPLSPLGVVPTISASPSLSVAQCESPGPTRNRSGSAPLTYNYEILIQYLDHVTELLVHSDTTVFQITCDLGKHFNLRERELSLFHSSYPAVMLSRSVCISHLIKGASPLPSECRFVLRENAAYR